MIDHTRGFGLVEAREREARGSHHDLERKRMSWEIYRDASFGPGEQG